MTKATLPDQVLSYLRINDPILGKIIEQSSPIEWQIAHNYFERLVESIISQQLSVKAADTIYMRVKKLFNDEKIMPKDLLIIDAETIRACGVSYAKVAYIKDLAQKVIDDPDMFEHFDIMSDEEIIVHLTRVKGIGRWTVEMFLIFTMGRPDVFSYGDLGIRKAIKNLYGFEIEPTKLEAEKIAEKWQPYRSTACRYLWKSLDLK